MSNAFDYPDMRDTADSILTEFGQVVKLHQMSNTGGLQWEPVQSDVYTDTVGCILNLTRWYPSFTQGDVLRTDRLGLIAAGPLTAAGVTPTPFDRLIDAAGRSWKIIDVKPIYPGGVAVIYTLQLRI